MGTYSRHNNVGLSSHKAEDIMDVERLVEVFGRWPSFAYLCLATVCPVIAVALALLLR